MGIFFISKILEIFVIPKGSQDNEFSDEIELVDALLTTFDENENGLLEYSEFMKAFQETREQLGM